MPSPLTTPSGPIRLGTGAQTPFVPVARARIRGGLWGERRRINREVSVPHAWERLQAAGNFANLELAAAAESGHPAERGAYVNELPFLDSDLYKWLEAIGWTLADPELAEATAAELRERLSAGHRPAAPGPGRRRLPGLPLPGPLPRRTVRPAALGARALLRRPPHPGRRGGPPSDRARPSCSTVARRFADLITTSFGTGDGQVDGVCGHPEIETALVELHRETGESELPGHGAVLHRPARPRPARRRPVRPSVLPRSRPGPGRPGGGRSLRPPAVPARRGGRPGDRDRRARAREAAERLWSAGHGHPDLPDRRHRRPPHRRGVRRPVRAAERAQLLRDLRGHRLDHVLAADADPHRRGRSTPICWNARSTTGSWPASRWTASATSTPTRCRSAMITSAPATTRTTPGCPGSRCACCPPT